MAEPILSVSNLHVHIGTHEILKGATLTVNRGERIGIVGRNGTGKSTFMKVAAGIDTAHEGEVSFRRGAVTGHLPQDVSLTPGRTVRETVCDGAADIFELIRRYEEDGEDDLEPELRRLDAWRLESRIDELLSKLEAPPDDAIVDPLSGGEKRRVALCRALAAKPDLLLLDEPTNHLDMAAIEWLANWLKNYPGAVMLITHDRYFLDQVCTRMVELRDGQFDIYNGNYTDFIQRKAEKLAAEAKHEAKRQAFLRKEIEWVRRGPPARTTKSQSRLDRYYDQANADGLLREDEVDMLLPAPPRLGNKVINLKGVSKSYAGKSLFSDFDLTIEAGMRIGITGPNGTGKSTLLKVLMQRLEPDTGLVEVADNIVFNVMDQERMQLDDDKSVFENIGDGNEMIPFGGRHISARAYLKNYLFSEDRLISRVSHLSGGERSRLLLAKMLLRGGNVLILDEPTNDLDLATLRVLEDALETFRGVLLVVSHDRRFLDRVSTHTIAFDGDGAADLAVGNYSYWLDTRKPTKPAKPSKATGSSAGATAEATAPVKAEPVEPAKEKRVPLSRDEQKELARSEKQIEKLETEIAAISALFADAAWTSANPNELGPKSAEQQALQTELDEVYARWETLSERA